MYFVSLGEVQNGPFSQFSFCPSLTDMHLQGVLEPDLPVLLIFPGPAGYGGWMRPSLFGGSMSAREGGLSLALIKLRGTAPNLPVLSPLPSQQAEANTLHFAQLLPCQLCWARAEKSSGFALFFFRFFPSSMFILFFLLLFNYSCLHFLPTTPPHPSQTHLPPPSPTSTLPLGFVLVSFIVPPENPSPHCPLPTPLCLLLDCS